MIGRWTGGEEPRRVAESRCVRAVTADNGTKQQPVVLLSLSCFFLSLHQLRAEAYLRSTPPKNPGIHAGQTAVKHR